MPTIKQFNITLGDINFLLDQLRHTILVVGYDGEGQPIYGYRDPASATGVHALGLFGTFDPLSVNGPDGLPLYAGARDAAGFRILEGFFNNLTGTQSSPGAWMWGSADQPFPRLTSAQYNSYVHQALDNAALSNKAFQAYMDSHPTLPDAQADSTALYADPSKSVVDYTPRMISQTISSSYMDHGAGVADSAMARVGAPTDTFHETITYADGHKEQVTETVIRNENTLPGDPSTSGIFTLFGQFFDHGLDFIEKGGQGTKIVIALEPSDPLYRAPGTNGPNDPGNLTITISRATPDGYTVTDLHGRALSIAGADGVWNTADDVQGAGADGLYGTADDVLGPMTQPTAANYTDHTSPYIDQSQTYGSDEQITMLLRMWEVDPLHTGQFRATAEMLDGHQTQTYSSSTFNDLGTGADGRGLTNRTVPTLDELRAHLLATGRDALTWDDINNFRARDAAGHVIDTNGAAAGGYVFTGQALLLDMNPDFSLIDFNNAAIKAGGVTQANFASFINFANFTIKDVVNGVAVTDAQYAAVSEALMESVGKHYVAGDGRANENFGLTALHHVWHENHNVQLVNLENNILAQADLAERHDFQLAVIDAKIGLAFHDQMGNYTITDQSTVAVAALDQISWNPDKMFSAVKLINEMEYQHVAIDQYARLVTPDLPEFVTYDSNINADISLEYAQGAFRFGHSQLRETIDAIDPNGMITKFALSGAFLNPTQFAATGAADIVRGMSQQVSNEVDEFLTPALQQSLLGQSLDLGAINMARGRDIGLPTLNETRRALHDALVAERAADPTTTHHTNLIVDALNPYTSWAEFGAQMIHPDSLVNFIAAYAFDGNLAKAQAIMGLDAGAIAEGSAEAQGFTFDDAINFLNNSMPSSSSQALIDGAKAFNAVDLWIGGLAEVHVMGGQLGATFNAIFEDQMERLMDGDRFYYLYRLDGALPTNTDLNQAVTTEQFKDIIERTTGALHLNGSIMNHADTYIELGKTLTSGQMLLAYKDEQIHDANGNLVTAGEGDVKYQLSGSTWVPILADDKTAHNYGDIVAAKHLGVYSGPGGGTVGNGGSIFKSNSDLGIVNQEYIRDFRPDLGSNPDGVTPNQGFNAHEVISGTDYMDYILGGNGDDTLYGDKGNDVLDGGGGADHLYGGDGQDVLYGGDIADFLDGGKGDDIVYAGTSSGVMDVVIGGDGNDKLYGEAGIDEIHGDAGDDYIDAGGDTDLVFGDAGNDIIFGGDGPDTLLAGTGDDMLSGGSGPDVLKGEAGDDIMFGGIGQSAQNGDSDELLGGDGFDIAAYSDLNTALDVAADLRNQNLVAAGGQTPYNPFNQLIVDTEGLIGSKFDDKLIGDDTSNWLIGGGGNDIFGTAVADVTGSLGSGGNDVIIGDKIRLDSLIGKYAGYTNGFDANGDATHGFTGSLTGGLLGNATLGTEMFDKHFTDLLKSERNKDLVLGSDGGVDGTNDLAVYTGNRKDYSVEVISYDTGTSDGVVTAYKITDKGGLNADGSVRAPTDGTDLLIGVDKVSFNGVTYAIDLLVNRAPTGSVDFTGGDRTIGFGQQAVQAATLTPTSAIFDANNITPSNPLGSVAIPNSGYNWQTSANGTTWSDVASGAGANQQTASSHVLSYGATAATGVLIHLTASYTDAGGAAEVVTSPTWNLIVGSGATGNSGNNSLNGADKSDGKGGTISDVIFGLNGNDAINGGLGDDRLFGSGGNDTLSGGAGNDTLDGGSGTNSLAGGAGDDIYIVNSASDTVNETAAGSSGVDTVRSAVTYTLTTNVENLTLTGNNINGTGNALDNVIIGSAGNNTLDGGSAGADRLIGGLGNDTYIVSHTGMTITEELNGGTDTVSTSLTSYTLENNVENLTYTGSSAFTGNGNALDNVITGGGGGADKLYGYDGNDTLNGGSGGADVLVGGLGNDTYIVSHAGITITEAALAGTDTVSTTLASYTLGDNLENLTYTGASAFNGVGNTLDNIITGNSGNDVLNGGGGNDTLSGGTGRDHLTGGAGVDTFLFKSASEAGNGTGSNSTNADLIADFQVGVDKIDLSGIDANIWSLQVHAFVWDNTLETGNTRPRAAHLGYHYEGTGANAVTVIDGNINTALFGNDNTVDFQIKLAGTLVLHASDFVF